MLIWTHTHICTHNGILVIKKWNLFFCNVNGPREYSVQFSSVAILLVEPQSSHQFTGDFSWKPSLTPQTGFLCWIFSPFGACCCSVTQLSDFLQPHGLQRARPPCLHYVSEFAQTHIHWVNDAIITICNK